MRRMASGIKSKLDRGLTKRTSDGEDTSLNGKTLGTAAFAHCVESVIHGNIYRIKSLGTAAGRDNGAEEVAPSTPVSLQLILRC